MALFAQLGLIISALISPIPEPSTTITLTMQMEEVAAAMVGIEAELTDRTEERMVYGRCVSDTAGLCVMELTDDTMPELVRGRLDLGPSGRRSFIVQRGSDQEVIILFDRFGQMLGHEHPHAPHPTVDNFVQREATPLPTAIDTKPTATAKFVVVNPETFETPTAVVTAEAVAEIIATAQPVPLELAEEQQAEPSSRNWPLIGITSVIFIFLWGGWLWFYWRTRKQEEAG